MHDAVTLNIGVRLTYFRGYAYDQGQLQCQHRIRISPKLQNPSKYVFFGLSDVNISLHHYLLSETFTKHKIDRIVPVPNLIKCKMQDNLEFLQWSKRYWDQYYSGGDYEALANRPKTAPAPASAPPSVSSRTSGAGAGAARKGTPTRAPVARTKWSAGGGGGGSTPAVIAENAQLKDTVAGLERERDFYFSKLREIEVLLQQAVEADPDIEKEEDGLIKAIQAILYSTEVSCSSCWEVDVRI